MRKRNNKITIRLTDEELSDLNAKVQKTGLSKEGYCRSVLAGSVVKEVFPVDVPYLLMEIARVGNNVNQILRIANTQGILNIPDLNCVIQELRTASRRIIDAYTKD